MVTIVESALGGQVHCPSRPQRLLHGRQLSQLVLAQVRLLDYQVLAWIWRVGLVRGFFFRRRGRSWVAIFWRCRLASCNWLHPGPRLARVPGVQKHGWKLSGDFRWQFIPCCASFWKLNITTSMDIWLVFMNLTNVTCQKTKTFQVIICLAHESRSVKGAASMEGRQAPHNES